MEKYEVVKLIILVDFVMFMTLLGLHVMSRVYYEEWIGEAFLVVFLSAGTFLAIVLPYIWAARIVMVITTGAIAIHLSRCPDRNKITMTWSWVKFCFFGVASMSVVF
jgi:hypothetical protein